MEPDVAELNDERAVDAVCNYYLLHAATACAGKDSVVDGNVTIPLNLEFIEKVESLALGDNAEFLETLKRLCGFRVNGPGFRSFVVSYAVRAVCDSITQKNHFMLLRVAAAKVLEERFGRKFRY